MTIRLYDLAGEDSDRRFSPFCWRTRMALAHKGLDVVTVPWRFTDKEAIAFSGQGRVPVIVDGERTVFDSWKIALYLDEAYPDRPLLFPEGHGVARFVNAWADTVQLPGLIRLVVADIEAHLHPMDKGYFRQTREKRLGTTLEEAQADREARVQDFRNLLEPVHYARGGAGRPRGASPGFPQPARARARDGRDAALHFRRGARLSRLHCLRRVPMGALGERFPAVAAR
jgi:glutathione S-transferase